MKSNILIKHMVTVVHVLLLLGAYSIAAVCCVAGGLKMSLVSQSYSSNFLMCCHSSCSVFPVELV